MWTRLRHSWTTLSSGYWFVPAVMTLAAAGLALVLLYVDRWVVDPGVQLAWLYVGSADGARMLLSTVAGSVITVAGVVFSITIVALTQASSQFGPRLLRNFMSDTANQVVLGTFVATFVYCLLILRTVHGDSGGGPSFVPQASVTAAVILAVASIAVLIYFIHHVSIELQAPSVIAGVLHELKRAGAHLHKTIPGVDAAGPVESVLPPGFEEKALAIPCPCDGYLQAVNYDGLLEAAQEADLLLRLEHRAGAYLIRGTPWLRAWPPERCGDDLCRRLAGCAITGRRPTPEQDVEFPVRQLVEVAVRALSPGVNDPFTAMNCADALGSGICEVVRCGLPGPMLYGAGGGTLRVVARVTTFDGLADAAFNQIRQHARGDVAVTIRLLEIIAACAGQMRTSSQRNALRRHVELIYRQSQAAVSEAYDRQGIRARYEMALLATAN